MSLTADERKELHRVEAVAKALKAKRDAGIKARAKESRKAREKALVRTPEQRNPRVQEPAYLQWLRRLPCVCCGRPAPSEAAHIRAGYSAKGWAPTGMMQKPDDFRAVPLCTGCHREGPDAQHRGSERAFWERLEIDPPDLCAALHAAYLADQDGATVLRRFQTTRVR